MSKMIDLDGTKNGGISIEKIDKPYGPKSDPVISIGIFMNKKSEKPDYKSHIPLSNLKELIEELNKFVD